MKNIIKIQVANYEGATVEIDTAKVSRQMQDHLIKELQPDNFKVWETRDGQSYFVGGFQVVTMPLNEDGYRTFTEGGNLIFVNSKLPKAKRKRIVEHFIEQKE